ncbi:sensor domain-containing diguanylate cyclase [Ralstonia sp. 1138]|uniref:sensor domain-containing diguanylate cyclase n=1 Tax=Ralstonia sp. 1138 TaxID=3156423 RepID=UPI00339AF5D1
MTEAVQLESGRPSRTEILAAALITALIVAVAAIAFSHARRALPEVRPFLPMFLTVVVLCEGLTGYLLFQRARLVQTPFYGALAGAYFFAAFLAAAQLPTFPGVFSADGLLGAGPQSAVWLWTFWHSGYPLLLLLAALSRHCHERGSSSPLLTQVLRTLPWAGPMSAAAVVPLCIWGTDFLPPLIQGGAYIDLVRILGVPVIGSNVVALAGHLALTRLRRSVDVWVAVALAVGLADSILTLHGGARYTLGWYAARLLSVVSSAVVLSMLIADITRLYRALMAANQRLERQSLLDGLTQVGNRQAFDRRWAAESKRARRTGQPLSVLMIDIDHFKQVNDTYGHGRGDACLVEVASILSRVAGKRPTDLVARYGGEEFVVLLADTERSRAKLIAEQVRRAVEQAALPAPSVRGVVTVSIGVAAYAPSAGHAPVADATSEALMQADMALYDAKRAGRNAVMVR